MPPFTDYDSFFDFLTQFFPDLYHRPPNLQLPGLGEWLSPFITIERLADGQILPPHAAAAEWAARNRWPFPSSDESCDATPHYRLLVAPVDDFAPFQRLLTAPDLFTRKLALFLCLVLSNHPTNASTILTLLAHEFILDSGSYDPTPEQRPPSENGKSPLEWFRALFVRPPAVRLSLGQTPELEWDLPVEPGSPSFRTEILLLIRHIARRFLESDQPAEVAIFRQAMDLLEEVMRSGDTPPLRCVAGLLLDQVIYSNRESHAFEYPPTGLLAPSSLSSQAVLAKWGESEIHIQHLFDLAANPREPLLLRHFAVTQLNSQQDQMNENLQLRFHRLALDILWEAPASTKWDVKGYKEWHSLLLSPCFGIAWWNRHALPPAEYARFLALIRQALAFPLATQPPNMTLPEDESLNLFGDHPWPGWYLLRGEFLGYISVGNRSNLFLKEFPEAFLLYPPRLEYPDDPLPDTTEEVERLLLDLARSPADLPLLWEARPWASWAQQKWYEDFSWARYLFHAQAKFPPTERVPTLVAALHSTITDERQQVVVKLGALAHTGTGTMSDPTPVLTALATAVQDTDFRIRLLAIEGLRGFMTSSPFPLIPPVSVLRALQTAVLQDPEEVIQRVAMETLCAIVTTATLPDPRPVVATLLEITAAQSRIIAEFYASYPYEEEDLLPGRIKSAGEQALLTYLKHLENPTPLFSMLQSENEDVRAGVAWALGQLGDPRAVFPLIQALQDESQQVRASTAEALDALGDKLALAPLIQGLQDPGELVRAAAARALGTLGDPRALAPLLQGLQDPGELVRAAAAQALGQLGDPRAVAALIRALQDSDSRIRRSAAYALGEIGDPRAIDPLLQALRDPWRFVYSQQTLIAALRLIGDPRMVKPLIQMLGGSHCGRAAARLLGTLGEPALAPLLQVLQETDPTPHAIEALGLLGDIRAVEPLIQVLLTAESREVREATVQALGKIGDPRAVAPILQAMNEEEDGLIIRIPQEEDSLIGPVRANKLVVDALVQIGAPVVTPLTQALKDPSWDVREIARIVLEKIEPPDKRKGKGKDKD